MVRTSQNALGGSFELELQQARRDGDLPRYAFDPFDEGFFFEWSLLDLRYVAFRSRAALLLGAWDDEDELNAAMVVMDGVREITLTGRRKATPLTAWIVASAKVDVVDGEIELRVGDLNVLDNSVLVKCKSVEMRLGYCEEMASAPPDFTEVSPQGVMIATPNWASPFEPLYASATRP